VVVGEGRLSGLLSGIPGVELSGPAADAELAALYAGATALILPSLLEGFGLPAVEAAACAVPTVASDLPALRESLGDSFLAVPPGDPVALGDALFEIATDGALRRRLGTRAQEAVAPLSWEASAERMFELLREVAGAPAP
jgi:alpha-1,3-rhamnosyl/mannosyltransferase